MWTVEFHREVKKGLKKLPISVRNALTVWVEIASIEGPVGLRMAKGFNDEALKGKWRGYRSSRLSKQYRLIYRVEKDIVRILVVDITAHDYRRK
jgi:addiction module RelE/StbE family toxin